MASKVPTYGLAPEFEVLVSQRCAFSKSFWQRIGYEVDPRALDNPAARLALEAVRAVVADSGMIPRGAAVVVQRCASWRESGKVTHEQVLEVADLLDDYNPALPEETVVAELQPVLRRRLEKAALDQGFGSFQQRKPLDRTKELIERAERLGVAEVGKELRFGGGSSPGGDRVALKGFLDKLRELRSLPRLRTGIQDLDDVLSGGIQWGRLAMFIGRTGGGKSQALTQVAAEGVYLGHHVAFASLELNELETTARIASNFTGLTVEQMLEDDELLASSWAEYVCAGALSVRWFEAEHTSVRELLDWVSESEREVGRRVDLLVVDYLDQLQLPKAEGAKGDGYRGYKLVTQQLRVWAESSKRIVWTATQTQRQKKQKSGQAQRTDEQDAADSMGKSRVADIIVGLDLSDDNSEASFFVAKDRYGHARRTGGPVPCDLAVARIGPPYRVPISDPGATQIGDELRRQVAEQQQRAAKALEETEP